MWAAGQAVRSRRASGADAQLMSGSNECVRGSPWQHPDGFTCSQAVTPIKISILYPSCCRK